MSGNYCPHCMNPAMGPVCPSCGGDVSWTGQKGVDLPVGTVLSNGLRTYQIGAARGKGGFGITYVALELNSNRRMAVKEYYPTRCAFRGGNGMDVQAMTGQEGTFRSGMNSFLAEGKMLWSQGDLPSVVRVIDYFQANGTAYLAMEYLDGVPLHAQMARMGGRIPVGELLARLSPLMRDLGLLHQRGVIHRDISPDNIMWMPGGGMKLLDFGSARSMENGKSMTVLMKQGFSPIEQYSSKGQGPYTDIYALAATIYYCVTGTIPPDAMERMTGDTLQPPIALGAALTANQEAALLWALSIRPEVRPQNVEEFASKLFQEALVTTGGTGQNLDIGTGRTEIITGTYDGINTFDTTGTSTGSGGSGGYVGGGQQQDWPGDGKKGGGGKKVWPIILGVAGAAVAVGLLLIIGFAMLMGTLEDDGKPSHSPSTRPANTLQPVNSPSVVTPGWSPHTSTPVQGSTSGITDSGFAYEIIGGDHAVLTGCVAGADFGYMPDYVDDVPITVIADGAFSGADTGGFANLPIHLQTIGANAFLNCSDLEYVAAFGNVATESSSFSGCTDLWFVVVYDSAVSGWNLPDGVGLYYEGMETGIGPLNRVDLTSVGSLLKGETENGSVVLLDSKSWVYTVQLDGYNWICPWALDNPPYSIELGENTLFPYEMYTSRNTWDAPEGSYADMWLMSCAAANAISAERPSGAPPIEPDRALISAAGDRANELITLNDFSRPDGRDDFTALDDRGIEHSFAGAVRGYECYSREDVFSDMPSLADYYAEPLAETDSSRYAGEYYTGIGVAYSGPSDGEYFYYVFVIIP